jgi:hypothetical protein
VAKMVMRSDAELEGLSRNWRDSLAHALAHFSDLRSSDYGFHNRKWLVLSVHHAAEVFSNYLVRRRDSAYPPRGRYPSLIRTLSLMREHDVWATLTAGEQRVATEFLPPLVDMRNQLMHGPAPADIDVSQAALTALALLILVKRQTNASTKEFFDQYPSIEMDIFDELRVEQLEPYTRFVEGVVAEEYEGDEWYVLGCDYCGGYTRPYGEAECRACFHETNVPDE